MGPDLPRSLAMLPLVETSSWVFSALTPKRNPEAGVSRTDDSGVWGNGIVLEAKQHGIGVGSGFTVPETDGPTLSEAVPAATRASRESIPTALSEIIQLDRSSLSIGTSNGDGLSAARVWNDAPLSALLAG
jgi:hypothetical protein